MKRSAKQPSRIDFEKSLSELEEIVGKLETGSLPLEQSLELFERGVELARTCKRKLDEAELRVQRLVKFKEGLFREEPFDVEEE
ncbi:MAG: exodeoxyribonuclease VII small subunit [candidate division WOR-3 bacterium]|nr:MAG: exodeoxyribonuclease VII small subunit [candidate division WOR-3 bacterium]